MVKDFVVNGHSVSPGTRATIDVPLPKLYTHTQMTMPVHVVHGRRHGPSLFVSAAIHGDEINGVEIIRRLLKTRSLQRLRGTLVVVPIVNVYGFIQQTRYLPDRRDLNCSFPGSEKGSLAARLAHLFMSQIVANCTHGVDLHTGAVHRSNLPQIRANVDDPETQRLATAFAAPVILNANTRDGSLREAAAQAGIPMLLYEAGEALRFDEVAIRAGVRGLINVMKELDMLVDKKRSGSSGSRPFVARTSSWIRAPESGTLRALVALGARVRRGDVLGFIEDPFGETEVPVASPVNGILIGRTNLPLVQEGEGLFHVARFAEQTRDVLEHVEAFQLEHAADIDASDEPPIV